MAPIKTITLGDGMRPMGTVMANDGKHLYVIDRPQQDGLHDRYGDERGDREQSRPVSGRGVSRCRRTARSCYTANGPSSDVSVMDLATNQVTKKIAVGRGPWGLAIIAR